MLLPLEPIESMDNKGKFKVLESDRLSGTMKVLITVDNQSLEMNYDCTNVKNMKTRTRVIDTMMRRMEKANSSHRVYIHAFHNTVNPMVLRLTGIDVYDE